MSASTRAGYSLLILGAVIAAGIATPARAQQPNGFPVTNVNLRAGPGTYYPVLLVVPTGEPIRFSAACRTTLGATVFANYRGWMRSIYLSGWYRGDYYLLRDYAPRLGYRSSPSISARYWDSYYRDRPFYGDRGKWGGSGDGEAGPTGLRSTAGLRRMATGSGSRDNMSGCRRT